MGLGVGLHDVLGLHPRELLDGLNETCPVTADDVRHLEQDVRHLLGIVEGVDGRIAGGQGQVLVRAVAVEGGLVALQIGAVGQDYIRVGDRIRRQHVHGDHQLHVLVTQGLPPIGVGIIVADGIGRVDEKGPGLIKLAVESKLALHRLHKSGIGHHRQGDVETAGLLFLLAEGPGPAGPTVLEELAALVGDHVDDQLGKAHPGHVRQGRPHRVALGHGLIHMVRLMVQLAGVDPAAHGVDTAGERLHHGLHPTQHQHIAEAGAVPARVHDGRSGGAELAGDAGDIRGRDAGNLRRPLGGILGELLELGLEHRLDRLAVDLDGPRQLEGGKEGFTFAILEIIVAELLQHADGGGAFFHHLGTAFLVRDQMQLALVVRVGEERHVRVPFKEQIVVEILHHHSPHQG